MIKVEVKEMLLQAGHGLYAGESKTGAAFEINCIVSYDEAGQEIHHLSNTVDYVVLVSIIKENMRKNSPLLETLLQEIAAAIKEQYPQVQEISIAVYKLNPPIENFQGKTGVTLYKRFNG